jgi:uncharacterized membrane protein YidH (DUF202 family)
LNKKFIGTVLIVIGVALVAWGYNSYDSVSSQLSRTFNGEAPIEAWVGMVGGAICIVIGILKVK